MDIQFLGAAKIVTGSNYLITTKNEKFIVDCGLFQGNREIESLNKEDFAYDPKEIDFMILTHAHIDHSGRIPLLVQKGFSNSIYATMPTVDLCEIMLLDSAKIQEADIEWENRKRQRAGRELLKPLYSTQDAEHSLNYFRPCYYDEIISVSRNIKIRFSDAGHILGSAIVEVWVTEDNKTTKIVFSGDLGMPDKPIIKSPSFIKDTDYLIVESTYGNMSHKSHDRIIDDLIEIIDDNTLKGGTVIIPAFAVGRSQEIIYELNNYYGHNEDIPYYKRVPIYIDSPMGIKATEAFLKNSYFFNDKAKELIFDGDNIFEFDNLKYVTSVEESIALNKVKFPRVIISSSGMATAGRVRHHLKHNLWDENSAVVFVGYQAQGTLGRILLDGKKSIKLLGEEIAVKAKIYNLDGFSGHADKDMLLKWVKAFENKPKKVFVVHGEGDKQKDFAAVLESELDLNVEIPDLYSKYKLEGNGVRKYEELSKEEMEFNLYLELENIIGQLKNLQEKELSVNFDNIDTEKYTEVKRNFNEIQNNMMDLAKYIDNKK